MTSLARRFAPALFLAFIIAAVPAHAQWVDNPATGSQPNRIPDRTVLAGQSGLGPLMTAELVSEHANARQHRAVINAQVDGVELVNPAGTNGTAKLDQGHIEYWVDNGSHASSTSTTVQIDHLPSGKHEVHVALVGNDGKPMGEETTLKVHVP